MQETRNDFDNPWKIAIGEHFPAFLAYFLPRVGASIDWSAGYRLLDKELLSVIGSEGKRHADMLIEVRRKSDGEKILIHIEVQAQRDANFSYRVFVYQYRIRSKYRQEVVSLAVLADKSSTWRPNHYKRREWGRRNFLGFPVVKLLDWQGRTFQDPANPWPWLVRATLQAHRAGPSSRTRLRAKVELATELYFHDFALDRFIDIYEMIVGVLVLVPALEYDFIKAIKKFEEDNQMPRLNSFQKMGIEMGMEQGLEQGLEQGRQEKGQEVARKMLAKGIPAEDILELTGIKIEEIEQPNSKPHRGDSEK